MQGSGDGAHAAYRVGCNENNRDGLEFRDEHGLDGSFGKSDDCGRSGRRQRFSSHDVGHSLNRPGKKFGCRRGGRNTIGEQHRGQRGRQCDTTLR